VRRAVRRSAWSAKVGPVTRCPYRRDHFAGPTAAPRFAATRRFLGTHPRNAPFLGSRPPSGQRIDSWRVDFPARIGARLFQRGQCLRFDPGPCSCRPDAAPPRSTPSFRRAPRAPPPPPRPPRPPPRPHHPPHPPPPPPPPPPSPP